jgi:uncharacterized protein (DUF3820 family)
MSDYIVKFGRYHGQTLSLIARRDPDYMRELCWGIPQGQIGDLNDILIKKGYKAYFTPRLPFGDLMGRTMIELHRHNNDFYAWLSSSYAHLKRFQSLKNWFHINDYMPSDTHPIHWSIRYSHETPFNLKYKERSDSPGWFNDTNTQGLSDYPCVSSYD